jgi:hypothetical protein
MTDVRAPYIVGLQILEVIAKVSVADKDKTDI